MATRKPLVAGNWKMHGTRDMAKSLAEAVARGSANLEATEVAVCPPYLLLPNVVDALGGSAVKLGAQNVSEQSPGALTGEIAAEMLVDQGCDYVIVGHSERRAQFAETDELVAKKFARVREQGMRPILCVGETLAEREAGDTEAVVARQLKAVLNQSGVAAFSEAVVAYEPVWAIGTGKTASPEQAQSVHQHLRSLLAEADEQVAAGARIIYGGSMKPANAAELLAQADIDGGLIGGAALVAEDFLAICQAAATA